MKKLIMLATLLLLGGAGLSTAFAEEHDARRLACIRSTDFKEIMAKAEMDQKWAGVTTDGYLLLLYASREEDNSGWVQFSRSPIKGAPYCIFVQGYYSRINLDGAPT